MNSTCVFLIGLTETNADKTKLMILSRKGSQNLVRDESLLSKGTSISPSSCVKFLGVMVDDELKFVDHVNLVRQKCLADLASLGKIFPMLPQSTRLL